jgi:hypothetical protein
MTVATAFIEQVLLELGIKPSQFSAPMRTLVRGRLCEIENAVLQRTGAGKAEFTLQCEDGKRSYLLPREIFSVEDVFLNGVNITDSRVPANEIVSGD